MMGLVKREGLGGTTRWDLMTTKGIPGGVISWEGKGGRWERGTRGQGRRGRGKREQGRSRRKKREGI